jgi:hypothetical protein
MDSGSAGRVMTDEWARMGPVSWERVLDLARQIERDYAGGGVGPEAALRLARMVVLFHERLIGIPVGPRRSP